MSKIVKIVISVLVVGGGIGALLYSTAGNAFEYYKHVDEVAAQRAAWQGKPLQLHGYVVPGSIQRRIDKDKQQVEYKFSATNCGSTVEVHYAGMVPDTFKDGAEVVCKGTFHGDDFASTEIMAKCPSKYAATQAAQTFCTRGRAN